ncbi:MAG TPA: plectin 1 isoform 8, partial [Archangium sp.]
MGASSEEMDPLAELRESLEAETASVGTGAPVAARPAAPPKAPPPLPPRKAATAPTTPSKPSSSTQAAYRPAMSLPSVQTA